MYHTYTSMKTYDRSPTPIWEGQVGKSVGAIKIIYKYFIRMFTSGLWLQYGKDR